ncbi:hypothetical protein JWJ90_16500 [Desulfobulbus rhabdoformis]|uniref:hypothetical protein n=1 Tax=Desulfobulbus rhabdoformis TaxID=34032 RepID=UPI00196626EA|nr:hypothetical protein [Desulfobulbus rhabdoformis]MBM9615871.1 hypothetical protein [Desulfobulbus rhabdoformis]
MGVLFGSFWMGRLTWQQGQNRRDIEAMKSNPPCVTVAQCLQEREERDSHQKERFDRGSKEFKEIKEMIAANEKASQDRHDMIVRHLLGERSPPGQGG